MGIVNNIFMIPKRLEATLLLSRSKLCKNVSKVSSKVLRKMHLHLFATAQIDLLKEVKDK